MLTSEFIKEKARELGATICGIGRVYDEPDMQRDPKMILPDAKCIIGFGFAVPKALYKTMETKSQYYTYTNIGVKYIDEEMAEIFLLKIGAIIENHGYDACLQKSTPGLRVKGDTATNPEVRDTYALISDPVEEGKPAPDVIIDFGKAAEVCGLGSVGLHGKVIAPKYGSFMRWVFIITDMPLETDAPFEGALCDGCGKCLSACPGRAIDPNTGVDSWQCSVYYRGAHKSNPFMTDDFLKHHPEREAILDGEKRFDAESAKALFPSLKFLPNTHLGYVACLCGKACEVACYKHLKEEGKL